jgi:hypothetical protein
MRKYAAATALFIAFNITMLTPAVSASGGTPSCPVRLVGSLSCTCRFQCGVVRHSKPSLAERACVATCVKAKEATQH